MLRLKSIIKTKFIRSLSTIYKEIYNGTIDSETLINNNNCCNNDICKVLMNVSNFKHSLSLQNRFIINNELCEIDHVFINNLIKINN